MLIDILAKDSDNQPFYTGGAGVPGLGPVTASIDYVLFGDIIEVRVKDDDGTILGDWTARNTYPARTITAVKNADSTVAVTDDASNTYVKESKDAA